jgi:hypothetical protein
VDKANTQNENPERNTTESQQKQKLRTKINQTQKSPIDLAKDDGTRNENGASISGVGILCELRRWNSKSIPKTKLILQEVGFLCEFSVFVACCE